jgi:LacI family transcriptional regulator
MNSVEIAKLAGVSRSTVSRVINNYPNVPEETRQRVLAVIEKYNYVPHASARMLAGKTSKIIGLIIIDTKDVAQEKVYSSSYFSQFTSLVIDNAKKQGYNVLVCIVSNLNDFNNVRDIFYNKTISGGIFIGGMDNAPEIKAIVNLGHKVAVIGQDTTGKEELSGNEVIINPDNFDGAYKAVRYLIDSGHQRIAHISGDMGQLSAKERLEGYKKALMDSGIKINSNLVLKGDFTEKSGFSAVKKLLGRMKPDAVFASNDHMAIGAMKAIEEEGLKVPDDLSVIGFDDIEIATYIRPALTTVRIPLQQIAAEATEKLIEIIETDTVDRGSCKISVELIKRETVNKL